MNTPADIGIRKVEMAVLRDEAEKMGPAGKNWFNIVRDTLKSGGGKVKVIETKGNYAYAVANHPLGHVMGPVRIPVKALRIAASSRAEELIVAVYHRVNGKAEPEVSDTHDAIRAELKKRRLSLSEEAIESLAEDVDHMLGFAKQGGNGLWKEEITASRVSAEKMKAKVFKAPEKVENPGNWPSVFLAGAIDMGEAEDWQQELTDTLSDVECLILNPRRDDWDCVDSETMALTPDGPKHFDNLNVGDLIFTYSQEKDILEIQPIRRMNVFDIEGEMIEFVRDDCSFFFTGNHDLLDRTTSRHGQTRKIKASWFVGKKEPVRFPAGKKLIDKEEGEIIPYGDGFSDDHFRLAAWFLSEGSAFIRKDTGATKVVISQYKKNHVKVEEIKSILDRLDMKHHYDERIIHLDKDASDFVVGIMALRKYVIPNWVMDATTRQKRIFIREYAKGDGCMVGDRISYLCFGGRYQKFAEQMVVLCFGSGLVTKWRDKTSGFGHPVINISPHDENKKWFCMKCKGKIPYKGKVWCPTTDNGTWVAYRNGLPFVTGNSSWEQSIDNSQFREQVEWELKGMEDATFIAMSLPSGSKAPISLLELGLHVVGRKMLVYCPEGFYRKGNVDVVCNRYGVPVFEDFDEFAQSVKARMLETAAGAHREQVLPAGTVGQQKQYFVTAADRLTAREFVLARYRIARQAAYRPIQMVKPWVDAYGNPVEPDEMRIQPLRRRPDYGELEMEMEKRMKESKIAALLSEKLQRAIQKAEANLSPVPADSEHYIVGAFGYGQEILGLMSTKSKQVAEQQVGYWKGKDNVHTIVVERPGVGMKVWIYTEYGNWKTREVRASWKEQGMNRTAVARELVAVAKSLTAFNSLLDSFVTRMDVGHLDGVVDPQTYELAVEVYSKLRQDLEPTEKQKEAIARLQRCVQRLSTMPPEAHRNEIFKAAHALGIRLPSSMF